MSQPETREATTEQARTPLSYAQEQLWFLDQLSPGEITYNVPVAHRLRGPLDVDALRRALTSLVTRNAALRSTFPSADGTPYQVIAPAAEVDLEVLDATAADDLDALLSERYEHSFDLAAGPLYRFSLLRTGPEEHILVLVLHHIVTDGWSSALVNREISGAYNAFVAGTEPDLPELEATYVDHVLAQRQQREDGLWEEQLKFWKEKLTGLPVVEMPADRPRPAAPTQNGRTLAHDFPPELLVRARALAQNEGASLFMVLTAALNAVVGRYTGGEDIPLGIPMLGRTDPELEEVVGLFINMLVLRTDLSGDPTFSELVERVADANMDVYDNQDVPFDQIVSHVQPAREAGRNPLFQIGTQLLGSGTAGSDLGLTGLTDEQLNSAVPRARYDLSLTFVESADRLRLTAEYTTDLFDGWRVEALARHIQNVLTAVVEDPSLPLSRLPLTDEKERETLLAAGRGPEFDFPEEPVHTSVLRVAEQTPDALAAVCRGVELTYGELAHRSGQLARHLRAKGVKPGTVVAIAIDRDLDALVAMLGVMRAGGAYAVMDPSHPAGRIEYMIKDTAAPVVITRDNLVEGLPLGDLQVVRIDTDWPEIEAETGPQEELEELADRETLAYVLYTSGSTGRPKGVMIQHKALRVFIEAYRHTFGEFTPADRLLQQPSLIFDMSQGEIYTALITGASLILVSPEDGSSPEALGALIRDQRVTYVGLSPTLLSLLDSGPYPHLRYIMGGAEVLPAELVNKWNIPGRKFVNLYGPTEAAIASTEYLCEHIEWRSAPPIGRPEYGRLHYVVDRHGNLAPIGVPGELLIGGDDGLAQGYLNLPELTDEKFVPDPFASTGRVYRTGDLVRWTPDLQVDFIGRIDNQVKLRGLRIELGEIESALVAHPAVRMALVLLKTDPQGEKQLVGYYTLLGEADPTLAELRAHLGESIPEYMIPTAWVKLDEFPLTLAKKIDRQALPEPTYGTDGDGGRAYVAPATPTEEQVAEAFATVLKADRVSADAGFFDLGGSSLQAMRAVSRINKAFGVKINVRLLYGGATLAGVAAAVDELLAKAGRD
ncbi:amino acid adenylation domain-containing protein [Streptomyces sp. NPDC046909]|uniref:non-ribosomal peptide synthetase n=1 Tax=Streptomyces sp. NPDC046909 TaxID=3155617 RepID=UPI0033EFD35E